MPKKKLTFEEKLSNLEKLISEIDSNNFLLDDVVKKHEIASTMLEELEQELKLAKQKVFIVQNDEIEPF